MHKKNKMSAEKEMKETEKENMIKEFNDSQEVYVPAKKPASKLISIRLPMNMIELLRKVAMEKGAIGYQQIIKTYIADGLSKEGRLDKNQPIYTQPFCVVDNMGTSSNMVVIFPQPPVMVSGDCAIY